MNKKITRRDFLKVGAGTVAGIALAPKAEARAEKKVKYGMVIDLDRCFGCRACMLACKVENNTPEGVFWMHVLRFEEGEYPNTRIKFMPRPCMHCDNAPCVKSCPVGARYKEENGLTLTDFYRCIGCRYCQVNCPYGVNYFNWKDPKKNYYLKWDGLTPPYKNPDLERKWGKAKKRVAGGGHYKGVVEKCTFCVHRVEKGLLPACVANCPVGALHFGDLNAPESNVSKLLREKPSFRLLEEYGTEPRVYYIGTPPKVGARQFDAVVRRVER